jgi:non-heme chloroperoxidase
MLRKPVLIVHGAQDAVVKPAVVNQHKAGLAHARVEIMPNVGHAPFWDEAAAFNGHLRTFCERLEVQAVS